MAEDQKTRSLGSIAVSDIHKFPEWSAYVKAAKAFSDAKNKAQDAKSDMKRALRSKFSALKHIDNLDFNQLDGNLNVFEVLQKTRVRQPRTTLKPD